MNTDEFQETTTNFNNPEVDLDNSLQGHKVPTNLTVTVGLKVHHSRYTGGFYQSTSTGPDG